MKTENWKTVKEILQEVLPLGEAQRQNYLNQSDISPEIRREVESLLSFEEQSADLMNLSAVEFSQDFFDTDDARNSLDGQIIGVYEIVRELGQGGMGAVYLAERTDGKFRQTVALKLLKREMNTSALRRRFQQEREILASLEHPNIARLLDAGTTGDKIPFLAMEYVEGLPIDEYCSVNKLDLPQRLDLFRQVCAAVNFAHRNLIVHRDLKPSNILVNEDGIPKLLDFGISKIISAEFDQTNAATVTKLGAMTPGYASPEQMRNKSVTTATDIYSLGVILYELLSGHRPFEAKESDLKEIYQAVLDSEPPPPSALIDTISKQFRQITNAKTELKTPENSKSKTKTPAPNADTQPDKLRRTIPEPLNFNAQNLRGDLDNIVLKALRKEPERRYSSAENFAEDIHRHQRGLPVTARPHTFSYRAEKFIKRNRASVVAGILILLTIIGGVVGTVWQARVAAAERDRARLETEKAKKINLYTQNILNFSNPHWLSSNPARNRKATVAEALDEALKNIDTDLADEPEIQAEILFTLGQTYTSQGQFDKSDKLLRQAIEKFDQVSGGQNTRSMQAAVILGDTQYLAGKLDEAEALYVAAINYFRPKVVEDKSQTKWLVIALNDYGNVCANKGKLKEAQALVRESVELSDQLTGKDRFAIPVVKSNLGTQIGQTGDFKGALIYFNQVLEELRAGGGEQRLEGGTANFNTGRMYTSLGDYETAEKYYQKADEILVNAVGEEDVYTLQNNLHTAINYHRQGKYVEAKSLIEKTLQIQRRIYPDGHFTIAYSHRLLGEIYTKTNELQKGETEIREALSIIFKTLKEPNQEISLIKTALGENLIAQKRFAEAKEILTSALDGYVKTKGEEHPSTKKCRALLDLV